MKEKLIASLGIFSLTAVSLLANSSSTQAAQLAPGTISLVADGGIFASGNVLDFSASLGEPQSLGTPGTFDVTTSAFDPNSGVFGEDPISVDTLDRSFLGSSGLIYDLTIDQAVANALPGGGVQDGVTYNFGTDFGVPGGEFTFLEFDTDSDGAFGEADDFEYIVTDLIRTTEPSATGGFNVTFDFIGFFQDNAGVIEDTPSIISIFNSTTAFDPTSLSNVDLATFNSSPVNGTDIAFVASIDATITTATDITDIPEPASIMALIGTVSIAGGLLREKQKRGQVKA